MYDQLRGRNPAIITFLISGDGEFGRERPYTFVQLSEPDARDLLEWLSYEASDFGYMEASELRARCVRRLLPIPRNFDPAIAERHVGGATVAGRGAGYLRSKTEELLRLAARALQLSQVEGVTLGILYS